VNELLLVHVGGGQIFKGVEAEFASTHKRDESKEGEHDVKGRAGY
jgi:hypothetical protein